VSPLRGVPLSTATGLRLLIAKDPAPFLFDVDRGTVQPVTGLPTQGDRVVWVLPVGKDAVVVSDRTCKDCREARVYRVQHDTTVATRLGTAREVVAASDGRAVWMLSDQGPTHCTLRNVGLDGRSPAPPSSSGRPCQGSRNFPTVDHRNSHFAGHRMVADYRVVVGVTSACLAPARKLSARARWVRIR
jgi:hypothetical protein